MSMTDAHLGEPEVDSTAKGGTNIQAPKGIRRRDFIMWVVLFWLLGQIIGYGGYREPLFAMIAIGALMVVYLFISFKRLQNIGLNGALALLHLVPLANVTIFAVCLCFPEDFRKTEKMDMYGWIIIFSYLPFLLLLFLISMAFQQGI